MPGPMMALFFTAPATTGTKGGEVVTILISPFCCAAAHWNEADVPFIALCRAIAAALDA